MSSNISKGDRSGSALDIVANADATNGSDQAEVLDEEPRGILMGVIAQLSKGDGPASVASHFCIGAKKCKKPFNPVLGEIFHCHWSFQDATESFLSANKYCIIHLYPAYFFSSPENDVTITGELKPRARFLGNSAATIMEGGSTVTFPSRPGESYDITSPNICSWYTFGTMYIELGGPAIVRCAKTDLICNIEANMAAIYQGGDKRMIFDAISSALVPKQVADILDQEEFESRRLWQHVAKAVTDRDLDMATLEKSKIEDNQRLVVKDREATQVWEPRFFSPDGENWKPKFMEHTTTTSIGLIHLKQEFRLLHLQMNLPRTTYSPCSWTCWKITGCRILGRIHSYLGHIIQKVCMVTFNGHRASVTALAFDAAGTRLASGSGDTDIVYGILLQSAACGNIQSTIRCRCFQDSGASQAQESERPQFYLIEDNSTNTIEATMADRYAKVATIRCTAKVTSFDFAPTLIVGAAIKSEMPLKLVCHFQTIQSRAYDLSGMTGTTKESVPHLFLHLWLGQSWRDSTFDLPSSSLIETIQAHRECYLVIKSTLPSALHWYTRTLKMSEDVLCVRQSPDGRLLAVALLDSTIKIFYYDTLKFFLSLYGHKLPVVSMDISFDSKLIATASSDKSVKIWGLDFGDCHRSLHAHEDSVMACQFVSNTLFKGHPGEIWALAVAKYGSFIVTGSHDRSIKFGKKQMIRDDQAIGSEAPDAESAEKDSAFQELRLKDPNAAPPPRSPFPIDEALLVLPFSNVIDLLKCISFWIEKREHEANHSAFFGESADGPTDPVVSDKVQSLDTSTLKNKKRRHIKVVS
ncbi:hypothetical protein BSLG_005665 [Batrachochytrium salamandrivorans]|nr:hypothetical protein BSLG_005665 [Batrachochytrium salamandrivorans]